MVVRAATGSGAHGTGGGDRMEGAGVQNVACSSTLRAGPPSVPLSATRDGAMDTAVEGKAWLSTRSTAVPLPRDGPCAVVPDAWPALPVPEPRFAGSVVLFRRIVSEKVVR